MICGRIDYVCCCCPRWTQRGPEEAAPGAGIGEGDGRVNTDRMRKIIERSQEAAEERWVASVPEAEWVWNMRRSFKAQVAPVRASVRETARPANEAW